MNSAAEQALAVLQPLIGQQPVAKKSIKRQALEMYEALQNMQGDWQEGGEIAAGVPRAKVAKVAKVAQIAKVAQTAKTLTPSGNVNLALTPKVQLNTLVMRIIKRPLTKGECAYETSDTGQGHQGTVTIMALPGEWAGQSWVGEVADSQPQAEHNAATQAIESLSTEPELMESVNMATVKKNKVKGKACGKGASMYEALQNMHGDWQEGGEIA